MPGSVAGRREEEGKRSEPNPPYKSRPRGRRFPPSRLRARERSGGCGRRAGAPGGHGGRRSPPPPLAPGCEFPSGAPARSLLRREHVRFSGRKDKFVAFAAAAGASPRLPSRDRHSRGREAVGRK